jgi:Response regulator containing CheY-like receiver, AAA-type ATPase, and DNA-binding domains
MSKAQHKILLVDDDETVLFGYRQSLTKSGYQISEAHSLHEAKQCVAGEEFNAVVLDLKLPDGNALEWIPELKKTYPDLPVIVVTGTGDVPTAVKAMKSGAENYLTKPVEPDNLEMSLHTALELGDLRRQNRIKHRLDRNTEPFFGVSPINDALMKTLTVAAANDTALLIQGETGTGKGILARWIHENSSRAHEAFVELNCSSLRGDLLRSELFGHAKGAFTSSVSDREGLIEVADEGTLFLDEIGDMDLAVQAQLLKTIEERTYRRIGENRLRKSDFRLVCASNKELLKETESGAFRKDLYYRICVFPITVPPLRNRTEDIAGLAGYFLREFGQATSTVPPDVLAMLKDYHWPGNIRELRNMLERAVLLAQNGPLSPVYFPGLASFPASVFIESDKPAGLRDIEREYLQKIIGSCNGDKKKASQKLGISLATLYRKLRQIQ